MGNVHNFKVIDTEKPLTYGQVLQKHLEEISPDVRDAVPDTLMIVSRAHADYIISSLIDTDLLTLLGMLEIGKDYLLETEWDD